MMISWSNQIKSLKQLFEGICIVDCGTDNSLANDPASHPMLFRATHFACLGHSGRYKTYYALCTGDKIAGF